MSENRLLWQSDRSAIQRFMLVFLLPVALGSCCGRNTQDQAPDDQLANVNKLRLYGVGSLDVTVGSEPYFIDASDASAWATTVAQDNLTVEVNLGGATASLPQLHKITVSDAMDLRIHGIDVKEFSVVKEGLGSITASGIATNVAIDAPGNCTIDVSELIAESVTVNITGNDTPVDVHATSALTVNINGNGCVVRQRGDAIAVEAITGSSIVVNE